MFGCRRGSLDDADFDGVVSAECGSVEEAETSHEYLTDLADECGLEAAIASD